MSGLRSAALRTVLASPALIYCQFGSCALIFLIHPGRPPTIIPWIDRSSSSWSSASFTTSVSSVSAPETDSWEKMYSLSAYNSSFSASHFLSSSCNASFFRFSIASSATSCCCVCAAAFCSSVRRSCASANADRTSCSWVCISSSSTHASSRLLAK